MSTRERLDVLLVERALCPTRAKAQARILAGEVVVGDQRVDKPGTRVLRDAPIRFKGDANPYVSRAAQKLIAALDAWPVPIAESICLDVGASTGGFTDVLLARGAARVYAVDVGHNQLAWSLRSDDRVVNLEKTHIAHLPVGSLLPAPRIAVVDVSFISLTRVLPAIVPHLAAQAHVFTLIKPQFEVGRANVGKGGIVRDAQARDAAIATVLDAARALGLCALGDMPSPITGADGNIEHIAAFAWGSAEESASVASLCGADSTE